MSLFLRKRARGTRVAPGRGAMTKKRFALTWLVATVAFFLQPLLHGVIFKDFFVSELGQPKAEPNIVVVLMLVLLYPGLMTYLYNLAYRGGSPALEGARLGAIVGLLFVLPLNLAHTVIAGASTTLVLLDTPLHIVEEGLVGVAIGLTAGRFRGP
jgi:hypothetical protein